MTGLWEQRWHPLRREWVIVAAHRQDRPWLGEKVVAERKASLPAYDKGCTFCPGNARVSGKRNAAYQGAYVFDNDHPCVGAEAPLDIEPAPGIYRNQPARGIARVVCFTPRHDLTLAEMEVEAIDAVLRTWQEQYRELSKVPGALHVLMVENKGEVVGVSNPHPHGQIYATSFVFKTIEIERDASREHKKKRGKSLWEEIVGSELDDGRRILSSNDHAISFVPYFARYAYETFVGPRRRVGSIADLQTDERNGFAAVLKDVLVRFDNLWKMSFPYVMALHQEPTGTVDDSFGFHIELHPPLRRPGLQKYLAGPEIGGGSFLSDTAPEEKAAELRALPSVHHKSRFS